MIALLRAIATHPANRAAPMRALWRALAFQLRKRLTGRTQVIDFHGLRLPVHPDSHSASAALYFGGLPDHAEMRFMLDYLRPGDRFADIGANVGVYTLLAVSAVGPSGHVHAFEPAEVPAARLREALALNAITNVTVHRAAVSDAPGMLQLRDTGEDCTAHVEFVHDGGGRLFTVPAVRLDDVLGDEPLAMAKLDIEGFEAQALRGARGMLARGNPPVLQLELDGYSKRYGVTSAALIAELSALGYDCAVYDPRRRILTLTTTPWTLGVRDVLAISAARAHEVRARIASRR